jgi:hypothetical protein
MAMRLQSVAIFRRIVSSCTDHRKLVLISIPSLYLCTYRWSGLRLTPELSQFTRNPLEEFEEESRMSRYYDEWVSRYSTRTTFRA